MQIPLLIATATEDLAHSHSFWDALPHLGGMLMVLITLVILWGITAAVAKIVAIVHARQHPAASPTPASKPSKAVATPSSEVPVAAIAAGVAEHYSSSVPPEIAAVIAAAVTCMSGGSRRVISIKPIDTGWEKAGRQAVLYSHRIR